MSLWSSIMSLLRAILRRILQSVEGRSHAYLAFIIRNEKEPLVSPVSSPAVLYRPAVQIVSIADDADGVISYRLVWNVIPTLFGSPVDILSDRTAPLRIQPLKRRSVSVLMIEVLVRYHAGYDRSPVSDPQPCIGRAVYRLPVVKAPSIGVWSRTFVPPSERRFITHPFRGGIIDLIFESHSAGAVPSTIQEQICPGKVEPRAVVPNRPL